MAFYLLCTPQRTSGGHWVRGGRTEEGVAGRREHAPRLQLGKLKSLCAARCGQLTLSIYRIRQGNEVIAMHI